MIVTHNDALIDQTRNRSLTTHAILCVCMCNSIACACAQFPLYIRIKNENKTTFINKIVIIHFAFDWSSIIMHALSLLHFHLSPCNRDNAKKKNNNKRTHRTHTKNALKCLWFLRWAANYPSLVCSRCPTIPKLTYHIHNFAANWYGMAWRVIDHHQCTQPRMGLMAESK